MAVATSAAKLIAVAVAEGVPIACTFPVTTETHVEVKYGTSEMPAVYVTDYTVAIAGDQASFTVTPTASLIAKIDALILADPEEVNRVVVRRREPFVSAFTAPDVQFKTRVANEFDATNRKLAELKRDIADVVPLSQIVASRAPINVMDYYISGVHTDHTIAIDAAFQLSRLSLSYNADRLVFRAAQQRPVYFPPGTYVYSGTGVSMADACYVLAFTDRGASARIEITTDVYLLTHSGIVLGTLFEGFHVVGGKGALRYTRTGENVANVHSIKENTFDNYSVCAVSNESEDMPFWQIERNFFHGGDSDATIGVAIGGLLDCSRICDNQYEGNKYNVKIGGYLSGNILIEGNGFLRWPGSADRTADIWIVASSVAFGVNSGFGTTIRNNKFGNENLAADDVRILFAAEGAGAGRDVRQHAASFQATGYYISGVLIDQNRISCAGAGTAPFIRSYIGPVSCLHYGMQNRIDGGSHTYLIEYMGALAEADAYSERTNRFEIGAPQYGVRPFSAAISNYRTGVVYDPFGLFGTDSGAIMYGVGDDVGYAPLANGRYADITAFGGASKAAVVDVYGGTETAEVTFASAGTSNGVYVELATPNPDEMHWLEVDVSVGSTLSVASVGVQVVNPTTGATAKKIDGLILTPTARRLRVPFFFPASAAGADWIASVYATDFAGGARTKAKVARFRVYQARAPMNADHVRTLGDGTWDTQHILLGGYHLWVDASGKLRLKFGAPTSDTDGTVVGTQS